MESQTKKTLRIAYCISNVTLIKWLKDVPGINFDEIKNRKVLFPGELKKIYKMYGNPFIITESTYKNLTFWRAGKLKNR